MKVNKTGFGGFFIPRSTRIKSLDSIYHIMNRSISEVNLFREDKDKEHYLSLLKGYQEV